MKRSFGIDILRTVSIAMVIFRHFGFYSGFNWGYFAVESLFIVSGYLIGQMLFHGYYATPVVEPAALKKFMFRRWLRVFPLYYFLLIVKFILAPAIGINIIYYFLFLQNHFYGVSFFPVTWTLGIEEWFYVLTPLIVYIFMRRVSAQPKHMLMLLAGIILIINLARFGWVYYSDRPWGGLTGNIPLRLDSPLIGVLLAFIKIKYTGVFNKIHRLPVFLCGLALMGVYIWILHIVRTPVDRMNDFLWTRTLSFTILALLVAMMLPYIEKSIPEPKHRLLKFVSAFMKWGGKLSFAMYLTHSDVHLYLEKYLHGKIPDLAIGWLAVPITIGLSLLLHHFIEKKALDWRDKKQPDNWQSKI
ncbi:MAG: acyltransferase 3 [Bacteroidetes bacterium]|nr:MAG: acyltransferase 3 [Bacteroidota bacterium]